MRKSLTIVIVIVAVVLGVLLIIGIPCGMTCAGFCRCRGIPLGEDKCLGWKYYLCCVDCVPLGVLKNHSIETGNASKTGLSWLNNSLGSLSCEELETLESEEFNKLNYSCNSDADCHLDFFIGCGICLNKNSNTDIVHEIANLGVEKCNHPTPSCPLVVGCKCVNNKCEAVFE